VPLPSFQTWWIVASLSMRARCYNMEHRRCLLRLWFEDRNGSLQSLERRRKTVLGSKPGMHARHRTPNKNARVQFSQVRGYFQPSTYATVANAHQPLKYRFDNCHKAGLVLTSYQAIVFLHSVQLTPASDLHFFESFRGRQMISASPYYFPPHCTERTVRCYSDRRSVHKLSGPLESQYLQLVQGNGFHF